MGYDKVNHDLDEEEIEFQRMLSKKNENDDFEQLLSNSNKFEDRSDDVNEDIGDYEFSAAEKDRLSILEKFRSNLVTEAETVAPSSTYPKNQENQIESDEIDIYNHIPELKNYEDLNKFLSDSDDDTPK